MHRVLEIEHAELLGSRTIRRRAAPRRISPPRGQRPVQRRSVGDHQIPWHEVAVNVDARGVEVVRDDRVEGLLQGVGLRVVQLKLFVLLQVPVGKQLQLPAQQGFVVRRQHAGLGRQLPGQQGVERLHVAPVVGLRVVGVDPIQHGLVAQVAQQHEALRFVPGQHLGYQQTGFAHERGHVHEGLAVFVRGRRVHHDEAVPGLRVDAQVAPEAGVGGGGAKGRGQQTQPPGERAQPVRKSGFPLGIGPLDSGVGSGVGQGHGGGCFFAAGQRAARGIAQWIMAADSTNPLCRSAGPARF